MPREKQFESAAERQKAYRARKAEQLVDPSLPEVQFDEAGPQEKKGREPLVSLERYVQDSVAAALQFSLRARETDEPFEIAPGLTISNRRRDRLERARRYAEWRYQGYRAGEVASL